MRNLRELDDYRRTDAAVQEIFGSFCAFTLSFRGERLFCVTPAALPELVVFQRRRHRDANCMSRRRRSVNPSTQGLDMPATLRV
jgi:hypothetical protein